MRCHTRYCDAACQHEHWANGHKKKCKKIARGGGAEQYHADKKAKEAADEAVAACAAQGVPRPRRATEHRRARPSTGEHARQECLLAERPTARQCAAVRGGHLLFGSVLHSSLRRFLALPQRENKHQHMPDPLGHLACGVNDPLAEEDRTAGSHR